MKNIDFLENANNVYSTAHYIVAQKIKIVVDPQDKHYLTTFDTFYKRTKEREKQYCRAFLTENIVTGGRISCEVTKRKYID